MYMWMDRIHSAVYLISSASSSTNSSTSRPSKHIYSQVQFQIVSIHYSASSIFLFRFSIVAVLNVPSGWETGQRGRLDGRCFVLYVEKQAPALLLRVRMSDRLQM
jgi:hypothetical protein